jgi:methyl-accepting chemotaxis protein
MTELNEMKESIGEIAKSIDRLGNGNAETELGAIENLSMTINSSCRDIATALEQVAEAINHLAGAVKK